MRKATQYREKKSVRKTATHMRQ